MPGWGWKHKSALLPLCWGDNNMQLPGPGMTVCISVSGSSACCTAWAQRRTFFGWLDRDPVQNHRPPKLPTGTGQKLPINDTKLYGGVPMRMVQLGHVICSSHVRLGLCKAAPWRGVKA